MMDVRSMGTSRSTCGRADASASTTPASNPTDALDVLPPPAEAPWTLWAAGELADDSRSPADSGRAVARAILRALGRPVPEDSHD